jgi:glycosyltransferase involved in cell wall biosynthesis
MNSNMRYRGGNLLMNILYLTQFFSASSGGGQLIFYDLTKALSERGHKVFIICNVATETIGNENVTLKIVKPFELNTTGLPSSPLHNFQYITNSVRSGIKIARRNKIDIIHTSFFTPVIAGSILSKLVRVPMIASIFDIVTNSNEGNWDKWVKYNGLPKYYSAVGRIYEKISLRAPYDYIHTISLATKNDILLCKINKPIEVVYPSINSTSEMLDHRIERAYGDFILYIGRLVFYKNVDILIKAFVEVLQELPSAKLVVVGEGPMKEEWKKLSKLMGVSSSVIFTSHISSSHKLVLLRSCSALALPSVFEGFGLVILEAFAMGKPVLVANIPPLDEIVENEVEGFIIPHDDPHAWARKIIRLLNDKQLCKRMGRKAEEKIGTKFDFSKYINSMERLYLQVRASYERRS